MYPQLMNQAARLAPHLQRLLARGGGFATPFWKTSQIDTPDLDMSKLGPVGPISDPHKAQTPSPPISTDNSGPASNPMRPNVPALGGLGLFPGAEATPMNWFQGAQYRPTPPPAPAVPDSNAAVSSPLDTAQWPQGPMGRTPTPMARPAQAPAPQPDTGFFMRNAMMMQDPNGGGFIDPAGAASVRGPDLIDKMMGYLHRKVS